MKMTKTFLAASAAVLCLTAANANAAGFQLKEQSSSMQGLSFAGASAKGDDLSTMFFNPAGMTRLEQGNQISFTTSYVLPSAEFDTDSATMGPPVGAPITGTNGGDAGVGAVVPSFYGQLDLGLGERWRTGVSVNTPFGLSTKYDNNWVGRFHAIESKLMTINVAPTVAYKLTDTLSIGGNLQAQYISAKLTNAVITGLPPAPEGFTKLEGDDVAFGWGLGLMWQATEDTRVGANYRSRIVHKLEGDVRTSVGGVLIPAQSPSASAGLTTPDILSVGAVHDLNDQWSLLGEVAWTNWSTFDDLTVISASGAQLQSVDESWNDTWFFSVGTEYKHDQNWTFRGGVAYDQAAVGTAHRTARIPETDRIWGSLGATYKISPTTSIDMSYTYIHALSADLDEDKGLGVGGGAPVANISGEYDANVNIATVGVNFKF